MFLTERKNRLSEKLQIEGKCSLILLKFFPVFWFYLSDSAVLDAENIVLQIFGNTSTIPYNTFCYSAKRLGGVRWFHQFTESKSLERRHTHMLAFKKGFAVGEKRIQQSTLQ